MTDFYATPDLAAKFFKNRRVVSSGGINVVFYIGSGPQVVTILQNARWVKGTWPLWTKPLTQAHRSHSVLIFVPPGKIYLGGLVITPSMHSQ